LHNISVPHKNTQQQLTANKDTISQLETFKFGHSNTVHAIIDGEKCSSSVEA